MWKWCAIILTILILSLGLNVYFIFFQKPPVAHTQPQIVDQNHQQPISITSNNSGCSKYIDELNLYHLNDFIVSETNGKYKIQLVDRWMLMRVPALFYDNLIKVTYIVPIYWEVGYYRRLFNLFERPIFGGIDAGYIKEYFIGASLLYNF